MHLIIDGYGKDTSLMENEKLVYNVLNHYPAVIGMNKVYPPCVFRYIGQNPEDWGLSGFVILAESHITITTFVARHYINIDIFSCREFDPERVVDDFKQIFQLHKVHIHVLRRPEMWIATKKGEAKNE